MISKILFLLIILFSIFALVSANGCTDNQGICVSSCPATYKITSYNCEGFPITSFCCVPSGNFPCQNTEGYVCSSIEFNEPVNYGLESSQLACPFSLKCYKKLFKTYDGAGNYSLSPGDEIHFGDYIVKYVIFNKQVTWDTPDGRVTGNSASIELYKGEINYSNLGNNLIANLYDINNQQNEKIKTFSNGFWLYADSLKGESNIANIEIFMGSLSSCTDTDSYSMENIVPETSTGKWGRNYYKKGLTSEVKEDSNGRSESKKEDVCSNNRLIEYYCDSGELKSEEKNCNCLDDYTCKKGFFDAVSEWIKRTFGGLN